MRARKKIAMRSIVTVAEVDLFSRQPVNLENH
jgi:hypothetical protein